MTRHRERVGRGRRGWAAVAALILAGAVLVGLDTAGLPGLLPTPATSPLPDAAPSPLETGAARHLLEELPVKGRAPKTGYAREEFGPTLADTDSNSCSTREDILARDLTDPVVDVDGCTVLSGTLHDPYTGATIAFTRGPETSSDVQVDHVVALSDAWQKGAQQLTAEQRVQFANDPRNLLAVTGPANAAKGDADAATWLPPNTGFRCQYIAGQVAVKHAYQLWVTPAEHAAMTRILDRCTD